MSGFFVLGVPRHKLDEIVVRRVAAMERRLKSPRPGSTEKRIQKVLSAIRNQPPREVISHEFSVPQLCGDFIDMAGKQDYQYLALARKVGGDKRKSWEIISEK